ncbi:MAG: DUF4167 domain-containing protein [Halocynthiibacter sp.]
MRSPKSRSRGKNNRNRNNNNGNNVNRVYDSSGPEGKVRGTPQQIIEKYGQLARDAQLANDRVAMENFQQHAEHYIRIFGDAQREAEARRAEQEEANRKRQEEREAQRQEREAHRETKRAEREAEAVAATDPSETPQPDISELPMLAEPMAEPKPKRKPRPRKPKPEAAEHANAPQADAPKGSVAE